MKTWLLLDVYNLAYRALYSTGLLSYGGEPTGVLFGIFRNIQQVQDQFQTEDLVWCFDHGKSLREVSHPFYKETRRRRKFTEEEQELRDGLERQMHKLKFEYLDQLGYANTFFKAGYEADDVIASVCENLPDGDRAIIVSSDTDLWQLLSDRVAQVPPSLCDRLMTARRLKEEWNVPPRYWPVVKSVAGCDTDDIPGVEGAAEKTAARYVAHCLNRGDLGRTPSKTVFRIYHFIQSELFRRNMELIRLPYPGTPKFAPLPCVPPSVKRWKKLASQLGMESLVEQLDGDRTVRGAL